MLRGMRGSCKGYLPFAHALVLFNVLHVLQPACSRHLKFDNQETATTIRSVEGDPGLDHASSHANSLASGEAVNFDDLPKLNNTVVWAPVSNVEPLDTSSNFGGSIQQLVDCINSQYVRKNMTWDAAMRDDLAALEVAGVWWSAKKRSVPVTLVTQSSVDRIPQLYSQCKSWRGSLSAVMYLGLQQDTLDELTPENIGLLKKAVHHVSSFFADIERDEKSCRPDIMLVYEVYTERRAMMLYPINVLRNLARVQARTSLLALVDVDMLLSMNLYNDLQDPGVAKQLVQAGADRTAFVLPAFETYGQSYEAAALADLLVTKDKKFLHESVQRGIAGHFDQKRFPMGHNSTNFNRWYHATSDYQIKYGERYEPWVLVDRHLAPWHDTRFRGYGNNKIVHIAHLNATDFKFVVMSNMFIIHRSHKETSVRLRLVASKAAYDTAVATGQAVDKTSVYGHTRTLFDNAKANMHQGKFHPVLDPATLNCRNVLPWWKDSPQPVA